MALSLTVWEGCFQVLGSLFKNEMKAQKKSKEILFKAEQQKRQKRVVGHMSEDGRALMALGTAFCGDESGY